MNNDSISNLYLKSEKGFTLIEVLVAAAIFASVMLIAVATFTKMNQLNDRAAELRTVAESGRFTMDALARAVTSATGDDTHQSVQICSASNLPISPVAGSSSPGTTLAVATAGTNDAGTPILTVKRFQYDASKKLITLIAHTYDIDEAGTYVLVSSLNTNDSLVSSDVSVESFEVTGNSAYITKLIPPPTSQPFVTIKMRIAANPLRANRVVVSQDFRTSTVSRDYNFQLTTRAGSNICSM